MADRTSAALFAMIFNLLAKEQEPLDRKAAARDLWKESFKYDFSPYQMECDSALIKLGLAVKCTNCGGLVYDGDEHEDCEPEDDDPATGDAGGKDHG